MIVSNFYLYSLVIFVGKGLIFLLKLGVFFRKRNLDMKLVLEFFIDCLKGGEKIINDILLKILL